MFTKFLTEHNRFNLYEQNGFFVNPELFEIGVKKVYGKDDEQKVIVEKK